MHSQMNWLNLRLRENTGHIRETMIREDQQLVTNEPVEFEK